MDFAPDYSSDFSDIFWNATVSQEPSGKYFVFLCCTDVEIEPFDELPPHTRDFSRELGGFTCTIKVRMV